MDSDSSLTRWNGGSSRLWLLVSLLASLLVLPLLEESQIGRAPLLVGLTITIVFAAYVASATLRLLIVVLVVITIPTAWATLFLDSKALFITHCVLGSLFFWLVGGAIVVLSIKSRVVTIDAVFGAISAYFLFGLAWALSYWAIYVISPDSISFPEEGMSTGGAAVQVANFSDFIYYSFVTMSTLGFGDVTPLGRIVRTLTWIQAVTGQFYGAVIIAWLVSALPRPGDDAS